MIGVTEESSLFKLVGLPKSELHRYETKRINDAVRKYVTSTAYVSTRFVEYQGKFFVFVEIGSAEDTLALSSITHERARLYPGRIYVRTQDGRTAELTDPLELRRLIDRLVESRLNRLGIKR